MGERTPRRVALLAIHPRHAEAILTGRKLVEFRKRRLADDVATVVMYATTPVKAIVGEFTVGQPVIDVPDRVWAAVGGVGGIDRRAFDDYYAGCPTATAIRVTRPQRYDRPVALRAVEPVPAVPQSFSYLSEDVAKRIRELGNDGPGSDLLVEFTGSLLRRLITSARRRFSPVGASSPAGRLGLAAGQLSAGSEEPETRSAI